MKLHFTCPVLLYFSILFQIFCPGLQLWNIYTVFSYFQLNLVFFLIGHPVSSCWNFNFCYFCYIYNKMFHESIYLGIINPILTVYKGITEKYWTQQNIAHFIVIFFYLIIFFFLPRKDRQIKWIKKNHNKVANRSLLTIH